MRSFTLLSLTSLAPPFGRFITPLCLAPAFLEMAEESGEGGLLAGGTLEILDMACR